MGSISFDLSFFKRLGLSLFLPVIRFSYGFLLAMYLSKNLVKEEYGEWSLFISMIGLVLTFSSLSLMYSSQVIFPNKSKGELKSDIFNIMLFKLIFTFFVGGLFLVYSKYANLFSPEVVVIFLAVLFFRTVCDLTFGILRALLKVKEQVSFFFLESFLILTSILVTSEFIFLDVINAIYAFLFAQILASLYGFFLLRNYLCFSVFSFTRIKPYLLIGLPLIPFAFMDLIINAMTPLFIRTNGTLSDVALYSIAQKVALLMTIPSSVLNNIYTQYLSKAYNKSKDTMVAVFKQFLVLYVASNLFMFGSLVALGKDIIIIISSREYLDSYQSMILLLMANSLIIFSSVLTSVFSVTKQIKKVSLIWLFVLIVYLLLSLILTKYFSLVGAIYAILISFSLGFLVLSLHTYRVLSK